LGLNAISAGSRGGGFMGGDDASALGDEALPVVEVEVGIGERLLAGTQIFLETRVPLREEELLLTTEFLSALALVLELLLAIQFLLSAL